MVVVKCTVRSAVLVVVTNDDFPSVLVTQIFCTSISEEMCASASSYHRFCSSCCRCHIM